MNYVLVTGASTGIGYDACRYLTEKGFFVFGTVRKPQDKLRLEQSFNDNFEAIYLDVLSDKSIDELKNYLTTKLGKTGLYGLVNNAGIAMGGPLIRLSNESFKHQMDANFFSVFKITNALSDLLGARFDSPYQPGRIVNISSVSGLINTPMLGPYCISKHAVESMSDIYRRELALFGIRVILLEPGPIQTSIWEKATKGENPVAGTDFEHVFSDFIKIIDKNASDAQPVEVMSRYIHRALTKKRPKNRYVVAKNSFIIKILHHFFPGKWMDMIFLKQLKKMIISNSEDEKT